MDCETAKGLLGSYFDGELDPADRALVARHVENCPVCSRELEWLAKLDRDGRLLSSPEPPPEIWDRIAKGMAVRVTARTAISRAFSRRQLMVATGAVAVSAVGVFVTSTLTRRRRNPVVPVVLPPVQHISVPPNAVLANMSVAGPEDRQLVEAQGICANSDCDVRLGAESQAVKVLVQNTAVFACSPECAHWVQAHPKEALAKLDRLEHRHPPKAGSDGPER
jgi:hypothetical protein